MDDYWHPVEILEAMEYCPATCDPVYKSASEVLWYLQTGKPAVVDLRWSKAHTRAVCGAARLWAIALELTLERLAYGLRPVVKPGGYSKVNVWDVVPASDAVPRLRFTLVRNCELIFEG